MYCHVALLCIVPNFKDHSGSHPFSRAELYLDMNSFTRGQQTGAGSHLKHNWRWSQLLQDLFTLVERQELIYLSKSKSKGRYESTAAVL